MIPEFVVVRGFVSLVCDVMSRGRRSEVVGVQLQYVLCIVLAFHLQLNKCLSLNLEGLALMAFRSKVEYDPHGVFENWNPKEDDPCKWSGVHCISGKVDSLNLNGMSLKGMLVPELGNLVYLRTLSLCNNNFSGAIPKEIGKLTMLELLDLRRNNLSGTVPVEISEIPSLGSLFLCNNRLEGVIHLQLGRLDMVSKLEAYKDSSRSDKHGNNIETTFHMFMDEEGLENTYRRRLFKVASNLPANPLTSKPVPDSIDMLSKGSGSFPAIPSANDGQQSPPPAVSPNGPSESPTTSAGLKVISTTSTTFKENPSIFAEVLEKWPYLLVIVFVVFIILLAATFTLASQSRGMATISQWPSHLSGQLRRAFVAGVTKLNRDELEAACEEFSNIIHSYPDCTVYKGTLSDGVEIAVVSTVVSASKDWSSRSERRFRQKLDTLSRVNHKNFVNLLGYCKENEPFTRMMVFEFASGGTLDEHLHGMEHLDWRARMRIIMGVAYYLEYIHHQLKPPVAHNNLRSSTVLLTDDYAAKVVELDFWKDLVSRRRTSNNQSPDNPALPPSDTKGNVYSFGVLLLEIISGRPAYTREQGSIVKWASDSMSGNRTVGNLIDPTIDNFGSEELDIIYEVSQECVNPNPRMRPSMKDVSAKLRKVLGISPEAAVPRLSPLWWAELEILTVEAS